MEYLTEMVTKVSEVTNYTKVDELRSAEAERAAADLAKVGNLVRLWVPTIRSWRMA